MQSSRVGIGVVGYGYWGPNLVRNFVSSPSARLVGIADHDPGKLAAQQKVVRSPTFAVCAALPHRLAAEGRYERPSRVVDLAQSAMKLTTTTT